MLKEIKVCVDCGKGPISPQKRVLRCKPCSLRERFKDPRNHPMYGKKHTKAASEKWSKDRRGKGNSMYGKHQSKTAREKIGVANRGEKSGKWKGGRPRCPWCGKQIGYASKGCYSCVARERFKDPTKNPMYGRTHSKEACRRIGEAHRGPKNFNWHGGARQVPYTFEFSKKLKAEIRCRDGYKCVVCGLTEKEHLQLYRRVLIVHHADYRKHNCAKSNLATVCMQCNSRVNFNREKWLRFFKQLVQTNGWL